MFLIALGANLPSDAGSPARTLTAALARLPGEGFGLSAVSRFYRSPAFPVGSGPDYVNACAVVSAPPGATPATVLAALHRVEDALGRVRAERWQARRIDLDLIAAGAALLPDAETHRRWRNLPLVQQMRETPAQPVVPHPRLQDRAFVLIPLAEIAPRWRHPATGRTVQDMLDSLPDAEKTALTPVSAPFGED